MDDCAKATWLLDHAPLASANGSFRFIDQEIYAQPQELALDDAGFYAWSVGFVAEIVPLRPAKED